MSMPILTNDIKVVLNLKNGYGATCLIISEAYGLIFTLLKASTVMDCITITTRTACINELLEYYKDKNFQGTSNVNSTLIVSHDDNISRFIKAKTEAGLKECIRVGFVNFTYYTQEQKNILASLKIVRSESLENGVFKYGVDIRSSSGLMFRMENDSLVDLRNELGNCALAYRFISAYRNPEQYPSIIVDRDQINSYVESHGENGLVYYLQELFDNIWWN